MKIVVSSDEHTPLVGFILNNLKERGHTVEYLGPKPGEGEQSHNDWPEVTFRAVSQVAEQVADEAIVMCWTGTGASIAANKVPGIRAALCSDAETAKGARVWNHANVLALSLRATAIPIVEEILNAWFITSYSDDEWNLKQIERLRLIEDKYRG